MSSQKLIRYGAIGLVLGTGPLLLAVLIANFRGDPNPNPIGPGILAGITFWPALLSLVIGLVKRSSSHKLRP